MQFRPRKKNCTVSGGPLSALSAAHSSGGRGVKSARMCAGSPWADMAAGSPPQPSAPQPAGPLEPEPPSLSFPDLTI